MATLIELSQYPTNHINDSVFRWGDEILDTFGQQGYKIIKNFEPICKSVFIEKNSEKIRNNKKYWQGIIADLSEGFEQTWIDHIIRLCFSFENFNSSFITNLWIVYIMGPFHYKHYRRISQGKNSRFQTKDPRFETSR